MPVLKIIIGMVGCSPITVDITDILNSALLREERLALALDSLIDILQQRKYYNPCNFVISPKALGGLNCVSFIFH